MLDDQAAEGAKAEEAEPENTFAQNLTTFGYGRHPRPNMKRRR